MMQTAVIGAGPAGLMAAEVLARGGATVTLFDRMPSAGRKFLLAGRGGLNLTHSEAASSFIGRYGAAAERMGPAIEAFGPEALRGWSEGLGEPTVVGSSGRVFPRSFKASPLLRAWLRRLGGLGVEFRPRHRWTGWGEEGRLRFETPQGTVTIAAEVVVLALGGASWPQLGSDGAWVQAIEAAGVAVEPLRPSNCGFRVDWSEHFRDRFEGAPLKGIRLGFGGQALRGEATITRAGIEGGGIYALSAPLRDAIAAGGEARLDIALRPDLSAEELARRLAGRPPRQSLSTFLGKALKLAPVAIGLLQEAAVVAGEPAFRLAVRGPCGPHQCRTGEAPSAPPRSRGRSRPPAASPGQGSTQTSCWSCTPAPSWRGRCSTGKHRPAAICCRAPSPLGRRPDAARCAGSAATAEPPHMFG